MTRARIAGARFNLTGRRVLFGFLAFFALVIAADGVLVYLAITSWSGLTAENYYEKGLRYNETLREEQRQTELGWRADLTFASRGTAAGRLEVRMVDAAGRPLDGLGIEGVVARPTHEGLDQPIALKPVGDGRYRTDLTLPLPGMWELRLRAGNGRDSFKFRRRLRLE